MKKFWLLLIIPILGLGAFLIYQNRPTKRFSRHIAKARLYAKENNLIAAQREYESAYDIIGKFSPHVSLEVLRLMNRKALQDKNPAQALVNTRAYVQEHSAVKEGRILLAQLAFQAGDDQTAFQAVDTLLQMDSAYFPARLLLAEVRTRQGRLDLAEAQLRILYHNYPDSLHVLLPLAENLLKQGKIGESRRFLRDVLADHPDNAPARLFLVDGYLAERKTDSAQAILDAWQKSATPEMLRPITMRRGLIAAISDRFAAAESILAPYREPNEENAPVVSEIAQIKVAQGQYDSAIRIYAALGQSVPKVRALCERMNVLLYLKTQNPARSLQRAEALQAGQRNPELLPFILAAYESQGMNNKIEEVLSKQPVSVQVGLRKLINEWLPDKAYIGQWALVKYFELNNQRFWVLTSSQEMYKNWPQNALATEIYSGQLAALGQVAAAAKVLEGLKHPDFGQRTVLLSLYTRSGQGDKAGALAAKMLAEKPDAPGLNLILADQAMVRGDPTDAVGHYKRELEINPSSLPALNNLAWEYGVVRGDYAEAAPYLEKLRNLKVRDARIFDTMGWVLAKNGKAAEGEPYIRQALDLVPDFPSYLFHMGWSLAQTGRKEEARRFVEAALRSKLPFDERKEAESMLARKE